MVVGVLLCAVLVADGAALVLAGLTSPLRPPVGAAGVGEGPRPVVLLASIESTGVGFARLIATLQAGGTPVLDFDPARPGSQAFTFRPTSGDQHIPDVAASMMQPAIRAALAGGGYDPDRQHVDVVAHSVGGLLVRFLVERPGGADRIPGPPSGYGRLARLSHMARGAPL